MQTFALNMKMIWRSQINGKRLACYKNIQKEKPTDVYDLRCMQCRRITTQDTITPFPRRILAGIDRRSHEMLPTQKKKVKGKKRENTKKKERVKTNSVITLERQ